VDNGQPDDQITGTPTLLVYIISHIYILEDGFNVWDDLTVWYDVTGVIADLDPPVENGKPFNWKRSKFLSGRVLAVAS
jgi:hypothetical protein